MQWWRAPGFYLPQTLCQGQRERGKKKNQERINSFLPYSPLYTFSSFPFFSLSTFPISLLPSIRFFIFPYFPLSAFPSFPTSLYPPVLSFLLPSILLFLIPCFPLSPFHLSVLPFAFPNSLLPSIGLFLFPYFPQSTFPSFPIYFSLSAFPSFPPSIFPSTCLLFLSIDTSLNQTFTLSLILSTRLSYISPHMFDGSYTVYTHMDYIWECNFLYTWAPYGHGVRYVTYLHSYNIVL